MSDDKLVPVKSGNEMVSLLKHAAQHGMDADALKKLVDLHERVADRSARMAFNDAMKRFQAECPPLQKTGELPHLTRQGSKKKARFLELEEIKRVIQPVLDSCEMSYTWDSRINDNASIVTEECILSHVDGHSKSSKFSVPTKGTSGAISEQQRIASAGAFCMRQSLIRVLGLVGCNPDDDCQGTKGAREFELISAQQVADIEDLIQSVKADKARFLKYMGVSHTEDIPQGSYREAVNALNRKSK